jgi:hypothetical protein
MTEGEALAASMARDLRFIQHPLQWPHWPILPLKLRNGHILDKEFAALLFAEGKPQIYFANLHDLPSGAAVAGFNWATVLGAFTTRKFASFEALFTDYTVD